MEAQLMTISTDFLTFFFLFYCVFYNLALCPLFLIIQFYSSRRSGSGRGMAPANPVKEPPVITVMIPALNEEQVLEETIQRLLALPYPGRLEVLIIDDNSDDNTVAIVERLSAAHENVYLLHRGPYRSRRGKSDALNHGFSHLCKSFPERDLKNWVIGVFDADGRPMEDDFLLEVGRTFGNDSVTATQCGVRIWNNSNLLAALQDVEFLAWSFIAQTVRNRISGAVALGGNGQFIRASVLNRLSQEGSGWDEMSLTEDLDIGARILLDGGRIRFMNRWIEQEGVESFKALLRQRHRWAWGTLQVFLKYLLSGRIMTAKISLVKKLDLHYYLSFWIVPFVVLFSFILSFLNLTGILRIANNFGSALLLINSFSFVPLIILGLLWAKVPIYKTLYLVPLAVVYAYHWIPAVILGCMSILIHRKPYWVKTIRYTTEEVTTIGEMAK
jgi:1,2-diacylglycerol 3-beta-glucosyltransferase